MTPRPDAARAAGSVRGRLLAVLLVPVVGLLVAGTALDYYASLGPVGAAYDRALGDVALVAASYLRPGTVTSLATGAPPELAEALGAGAGGGSRRFALRDGAGRLLAGEAALPAPPPGADDRLSFGDAWIAGRWHRIAWYSLATADGRARITVAEPAGARERTRRSLLAATLLVDLLQVIAIPLLVVIGVRVGLRPLLALRERLAVRSARELEPLALDSVPVEARPLVEALNALFVRMRAAAESQQKFVADAAHQMRTPLAGIQAQLDLLERDPAAAAVRERVRAAGDGIRRLAHTANQLLALARAESAVALERDFRALDLGALGGEIVARELDRALARGIDLGVEGEPATVRGVEWLLRELVANLVDNALTYTPRGGVVTLRTGAGPAGAWLEVEDDGPGIPAEERPLVTQRFHRAAGATGTGSGLGLAIVSDIATLHGATLTLEAGAGGRGTRVHVGFGAPPAG